MQHNPHMALVPFQLIDDEMPSFNDHTMRHAIAAVHIATGKRYLIKVSDLATREQLTEEVKRMNRRPGNMFHYTLTNEGAKV